MKTDEPRAWLAVLGCFIINFVAFSLIKSSGILLIELLETFENDIIIVSWTASVVTGLSALIAPLITAVISTIGSWRIIVIGGIVAFLGPFLGLFAQSGFYLILTYGIFTGSGIGMCYGPSLVTVAKLFERRRAFAIGVAVSGSTFAQIVGPPFIRYIVAIYTWRGYFLILSALFLNFILAGLCIRFAEFDYKQAESVELVEISKTQTYQKKWPQRLINKLRHITSTFINSLDFKLLSDKKFLLAFSAFIFQNLGYVGVIIFLYPFAVESGISSFNKSLLIPLAGLSELPARIIGGHVTDLYHRRFPRSAYSAFFCLLTGATVILCTKFPSDTSFMASYVLFGLFMGTPMVLYNPILADVVGVGRMAPAFGMVLLGWGVTGTFLALALGAVRATTKSYNLPVLCIGLLFIIAAVFYLTLSATRKQWPPVK